MHSRSWKPRNASATKPRYQQSSAAPGSPFDSSRIRSYVAASCGFGAARRGAERIEQIHIGRRRPLVAEELLDVADRVADLRQHRIAVARVADREAQHLVQRQRPVVAEHRHPAAERAGHDGCERPRSRHELEPELVAVALDRRGARRRPLRAEDDAARRPRARGARAGRRPGPFRCGSTTWSVKPAATAASNALPPCSSTAIPAADASQCVDATMPKVPRSSGRVVNVTARG